MPALREQLALNFLSLLQRSGEKYQGKGRKAFPLIYQMGFSYVPGKQLFIFFMSFLDLSPDSLVSCFSFSLNLVYIFQKKLEFQNMKEANVTCVCAAESVFTSTIRRFKFMIKDIVKFKPAESTLSDIDTILVEIHRCPKC